MPKVQIDETRKVLKAVRGRLSYHQFSAAAAHADALTGPYSKQAEMAGQSKPYANILLTDAEYDRVVAFLTDEFFPMCLEIHKQDPQAQLAAEQDEVDQLLKQIEAGKKKPYNQPFSKPNDKTLALWPEAVSSLKCVGKLGVDLQQEAIVRDELMLKKPDPNQVKFPVMKPIGETNYELYSGCWVMTQIDFWLYRNGSNPGLRADIGTVLFVKDDKPFGGGTPLDEDAIFAALDD